MHTHVRGQTALQAAQMYARLDVAMGHLTIMEVTQKRVTMETQPPATGAPDALLKQATNVHV